MTTYIKTPIKVVKRKRYGFLFFPDRLEVVRWQCGYGVIKRIFKWPQQPLENIVVGDLK